MSRARARYLLSKHAKNQCTPAETQELADWILRSSTDADIKEVLDELWAEFSPTQYIPEEHADTILQTIIQTPQASSESDAWWKWAAAASIIIIAGTIGWFYSPKQTTPIVQKTITRPKIQEILPGTTRAMLTLADGTKIALDTVSSGNIAQQASISIIHKNGQILYQNNNATAEEMIYNTLSTARGQQFPLTLSDGTRVWLNAASSIRFPVLFDKKQRQVEITGEAYFEVAKNATRPFRVLIGETTIEVLGTHFNVNAYSDEASLATTLLEGSVKIKRDNTSLLLKPGQQAGVQKTGAIELKKEVDTEEVIAWKEGYFHFNNSSLEAILRQISRWYDVDVVYHQRKSDETFGGDIQKDLSLSQVLKILEKSQVHFKVDGKKLIVLK